MDQIKVAITEDDSQTRKLLDYIVHKQSFLTCVGSAGNETELMRLIREKKPDLLVTPSLSVKILGNPWLFSLLQKSVQPGSIQYRVQEQPSMVRENALQGRITEILHEVGIPAHIRGYHYLREAVRLTIENKALASSVTKKIYPAVAAKYATTPSRVERAIRHAIEVGWNRGRLELIDGIFGYSVQSGRGKPTNAEFIALIADKIRLEYQKSGGNSSE